MCNDLGCYYSGRAGLEIKAKVSESDVYCMGRADYPRRSYYFWYRRDLLLVW